MKTELTEISETQKHLVFEVPTETVNTEIARVAQDYSRKARVPGFRQGKVPKALENARISFHQGNHFKTRYWAQFAIKINPNIEEPWLWLAAVSSPHASIAYLKKALRINPQS